MEHHGGTESFFWAENESKGILGKSINLGKVMKVKYKRGVARKEEN